MAQFINTNIASLNAQRNLNTSQGALQTSLQRLSSGLRINSAKDDAAGLAISDRMTAQIQGLDQANRNANDGVSLAQTGEGALTTAGDILQRIRVLAVQAANATNTTSDRGVLQAEANQLTAELDRMASTTQFNGQNILDGSLSSATFQVGANANQTITATTANFHTANYGNYRIGSLIATTSNGLGDLTAGSAAANAIASSATLGASRVTGGTFDINGAAGTKTITENAGDSAKTIARKINDATGSTGVTASARTEFEMNGFTTGGAFLLSVMSNNSSPISISFNIGAALNADGLAAGIKAFNDVSAATGVTAKLNDAGTGITLLNADGGDITITNNSSTATVNIGSQWNGTAYVGGVTPAAAGGVAVATGSLTLDSDRSFGVSGVTNTADFFNLGTAAAQLQTVSAIDISSVAGANRAINQVDAALATVDAQRAAYGALQSRFTSTISNLAISSENLTQARSRIRDTDFAAETASLTRAQILQQAGTAMLAQANALPNNVLSLLK